MSSAAHLTRMRLRAQVEIEAEEHTSHVVFGAGDGVPTDEYGVPAVEVLDTELAPTVGDDELELLRIRACTPRWGRELDERVLPAEAGLEERAISFTKGCYPGQEPIARLHYRGHANRGLRVLEIEGSEPPAYDAEVLARRQGRGSRDERRARGRARRRSRLRSPRGP